MTSSACAGACASELKVRHSSTPSSNTEPARCVDPPSNELHERLRHIGPHVNRGVADGSRRSSHRVERPDVRSYIGMAQEKRAFQEKPKTASWTDAIWIALNPSLIDLAERTVAAHRVVHGVNRTRTSVRASARPSDTQRGRRRCRPGCARCSAKRAQHVRRRTYSTASLSHTGSPAVSIAGGGENEVRLTLHLDRDVIGQPRKLS